MYYPNYYFIIVHIIHFSGLEMEPKGGMLGFNIKYLLLLFIILYYGRAWSHCQDNKHFNWLSAGKVLGHHFTIN